MKTTPWFPMSVKPVREGPYALRWADGASMTYPFHYWAGDGWGERAATPEACAKAYQLDPEFQCSSYIAGPVEWRGVVGVELDCSVGPHINRWTISTTAGNPIFVAQLAPKLTLWQRFLAWVRK